MSNKDKMKTAYHDSISIYDSVLTQGNILSRMYISFFWSGTDDNRVAEELLSYIPDDFAGSMLDVPVGTAVFTEKKWRRLSAAKITCLDYSEDIFRKTYLAVCANPPKEETGTWNVKGDTSL